VEGMIEKNRRDFMVVVGKIRIWKKAGADGW
jgi:hypothetical protein